MLRSLHRATCEQRAVRVQPVGDSSEVRTLLAALTPKVAQCSEVFTAQHVSNALCGLQSMGDSSELRTLLAALKKYCNVEPVVQPDVQQAVQQAVQPDVQQDGQPGLEAVLAGPVPPPRSREAMLLFWRNLKNFRPADQLKMHADMLHQIEVEKQAQAASTDGPAGV